MSETFKLPKVKKKGKSRKTSKSTKSAGTEIKKPWSDAKKARKPKNTRKLKAKETKDFLNIADSLGEKGNLEHINFGNSFKANPKFNSSVNKDHSFKVCDGNELNNLLELAMAIKHMPEETFSHHVNEHKNDFASWIKDCMGEAQLANELGKYKTKSSNELLILRHITNEVKDKGLF